jgi:hypothetical protein
MQYPIIPSSSQAKVFLLFMLSPAAILIVTVIVVFSLSDTQIEDILNTLHLDWFRWPSIEKLIEYDGSMVFDRVRLFVATGLLICVLSIPFMCLIFVRYGDDALRRGREVFTREILLSCIAVSAISLAVIFLFPNGYVPVTSRKLVEFPPNFWGMSVLIIFLYGIFFCLFPIVFWVISLIHHRIRGESGK